MKTVFTILLLCSVAVSQQATPAQSSERTDGSLRWDSGSTLHDSEATCQPDPERFAYVAKCNFGKHTPEEVINWVLSELHSEQSETRRQRDIAEGWRKRYVTALEISQAIIDCTKAIIDDHATDASPVCQKKYALVAILKRPLPGEAIKKKAQAGAHSETSGKPDSEKPEKKLP